MVTGDSPVKRSRAERERATSNGPRAASDRLQPAVVFEPPGRSHCTDNGGKGRVAGEVSYREAIVLEPDEAMIGEPYYEPFAVPVLRPEEIVAEKLRALAQRPRPTDLSDLAWLLERVGGELDDALVAKLVTRKFVPGLVAPGDHQGRVLQQIDGFAGVYDDQVPALAPDAPSYSAASAFVKARLARFFS